MKFPLLAALPVLGALELYTACCVAAGPEPEASRLPEDHGIVLYRRIPIGESCMTLESLRCRENERELPRQSVEAQIQLTQAELIARQQQVSEYDKNFRYTSALFLARRQAHIDLLATALRLQRLRQEQQLLQQPVDATLIRRVVIDDHAW